MILPASDAVEQHVKTIADLRKKCLQDVGKWVSLHPDLPLADVLSFERLYIKFSNFDKGYKARGRIRECYKYALHACFADSNLIYCEGLAANKNCSYVPLEHAWCVREDTGEVVDPTWKNKHQGVGYCGVPLHFNFVKDVTRQTNFYGVLPHMYLVKSTFYSMLLRDVVHPVYHAQILKTHE